MTRSGILGDYIDSMEYVETQVSELTTDKLKNLERKQGLTFTNKRGLPFYVHRKIVVMDVLGQPTIMEKVDEFAVIDVFGVLGYEDTAENCVEYVKGLVD